MIEIKFRAWDISAKRMIGWHDAMFVNLNSDGINTTTTMLCEYPLRHVNSETNFFSYMQYTSLKDKNGVEIYVGDILQEEAPRGNKYKVFNVRGGFALNEHQEDLNKSPHQIMFYSPLSDMQNMAYITQGCKVIGNVNQNEELLKVNKEQS